MPYFLDNRDKITIDPTPHGRLRLPQVGAAFSVAAHFTVKEEAAIVTLPTGTGKTALMTLIPYLLCPRRVLVVTPSRLLRDQALDAFSSLSVLRTTRTLQPDTPSPKAVGVEHRLNTLEDWHQLAEYDVVVGTPYVLSPGISGVAAPPEDLFDLLIFDEAHHTPARIYSALHDALPNVRIVDLTATPFRGDKKGIKGCDVYTYPLSKALKDGYLAPIIFRPVPIGEGYSQTAKDRALALAATSRYSAPEHRAANSRLIVRTSTVKHAIALVDLYARSGLKLGLVTAQTTGAEVTRLLRDIESGDLAGLVNVGVLGEGFDFPLLKIGVYHTKHSSLPATFQFLGRITRLVQDGPPAELLAIREEISNETHDLYSSDTAWSTLVPQLVDAAVDSERQRRDYLRSFSPDPRNPLSLGALRTRKDIQVFCLKESSGTIDLTNSVEALGGGEVIYHGTDSDGRLSVVITEHLERPEWMDADTLDGFRYELHVLVVDASQEYVFVHGTRDSTIQQLLTILGLDEPIRVDPQWLDRLMNAIAVENYHSVGMRSARAAGGRLAAYRMMAGNGVGAAILPSETRSYGTGHAIARVQDPLLVSAEDLQTGRSGGGKRITSIGISYGRSKVFSPDLPPLLDFRKWCDRLADLAASNATMDPHGLPGLTLPSPRRIEEFPENPYLALIEPQILAEGLRLSDPTTGAVYDFQEFIWKVMRATPYLLALEGRPETGSHWTGHINIHGRTESKSGSYQVHDVKGQDRGELGQFLTENPVTVFFGSGDSTMGSVLFRPRDQYPPLPPATVHAWPFDKVDCRAESKNAKPGMITVAQYAASKIRDMDHLVALIDDDRANEVADLIAILDNPADPGFRVLLVHNKYSSEDEPGTRAKDFYELLAQAARSAQWLDPKRLAGRVRDRLRHGSKVLFGNPNDLNSMLDTWVSSPPVVQFLVMAVQPGFLVSKMKEGSNLHIMISDTLEWISQHDATLQVYGIDG